MYNTNYPGYVPSLGNGQAWGGGFGQPQAQAPVSQTRGNKIYVIDANDALSRMAMPDSLMVYVQQDETAIHEVYTDNAGRKLIRTRVLTEVGPSEEPTEEFVTRKEFEDFKAAVGKLGGGVSHDE